VSQRTPVWITGVGAATPLGHTYEAIAEGLLNGRSGVAAVCDLPIGRSAAHQLEAVNFVARRLQQAREQLDAPQARQQHRAVSPPQSPAAVARLEGELDRGAFQIFHRFRLLQGNLLLGPFPLDADLLLGGAQEVVLDVIRGGPGVGQARGRGDDPSCGSGPTGHDLVDGGDPRPAAPASGRAGRPYPPIRRRRRTLVPWAGSC